MGKLDKNKQEKSFIWNIKKEWISEDQIKAKDKEKHVENVNYCTNYLFQTIIIFF